MQTSFRILSNKVHVVELKSVDDKQFPIKEMIGRKCVQGLVLLCIAGPHYFGYQMPHSFQYMIYKDDRLKSYLVLCTNVRA